MVMIKTDRNFPGYPVGKFNYFAGSGNGVAVHGFIGSKGGKWQLGDYGLIQYS